MQLNSQIFRGNVFHERIGAVGHRFEYPMTFFAFDLAELDQIDQHASCFGHNRSRLLSIHDRDYLHGHNTPILKQLNRVLPAQHPGERTLLVTSPRYLGYAFNPVNFHLRLRGNQLLAAVAEVNNTFGDRHCYPLRSLEQTYDHTWKARCSKQFHVSPFNHLEGAYEFTFRIAHGNLHLGVDLYHQGQCVMKTALSGQGHPINNANIRRYAVLHPLDTALNSMPRILWQAAILYYRKRLKIYTRPEPHSPDTLIRRKQSDRPYAI